MNCAASTLRLATVAAVCTALAQFASGPVLAQDDDTPTGTTSIEEAGAPLATSGPDAEADTGIELGGALRFTAYDDSFSESLDTKRGAAGLDLFRINADGRISDIEISAEYRFYPYMQTLHHGWIGYDFERAGRIEGGVTQVPFGLLPYASHNFWFDVPYYLGFSDDYDLGAKYLHEYGPWSAQLAFFKNEEFNDSTKLERYSYDLVSTGPDGNEEANQLNARIAHELGEVPGCTFEPGLSLMRGDIYNTVTGLEGERRAAAAHADIRCGRWNVQGQWMRYEFEPRNPAGIGSDSITVGAFTGSHSIAARGKVYVANFAYNLPVPWQAVDLLTCYNDYSRLDKDSAGWNDSELNVTGCVINIGPTYTYIDYIRGRNMVFLGDGSLAGSGSDDWESRININVGFYF